MQDIHQGLHHLYGGVGRELWWYEHHRGSQDRPPRRGVVPRPQFLAFTGINRPLYRKNLATKLIWLGIYSQVIHRNRRPRDCGDQLARTAAGGSADSKIGRHCSLWLHNNFWGGTAEREVYLGGFFSCKKKWAARVPVFQRPLKQLCSVPGHPNRKGEADFFLQIGLKPSLSRNVWYGRVIFQKYPWAKRDSMRCHPNQLQHPARQVHPGGPIPEKTNWKLHKINHLLPLHNIGIHDTRISHSHACHLWRDIQVEPVCDISGFTRHFHPHDSAYCSECGHLVCAAPVVSAGNPLNLAIKYSSRG